MKHDVVSPKSIESPDNDKSMRPKSFDTYIGQESLVKKLKIAISAAKKRNDAVDHILLSGHAGLGKTTIAYLVANELDSNPKCIVSHSIKTVADIVELLKSLDHQAVLFIDEIHGLSKTIEEYFYSAMEDFKISVKVKNKILNFGLNKFTLIGATTQQGQLMKPMLDRFGIVHTLESYTEDELTLIAKNSAASLNINITAGALTAIAKRSRGVPRICNRLVRRVRDFADANNQHTCDVGLIEQSMAIEGIDPDGLTLLDLKYMKVINDVYSGGPVGINPIVASLEEDKRTIEQTIEPFLLRTGYVGRETRGRTLTDKGFKVVRNLNDDRSSTE